MLRPKKTEFPKTAKELTSPWWTFCHFFGYVPSGEIDAVRRYAEKTTREQWEELKKHELANEESRRVLDKSNQEFRETVKWLQVRGYDVSAYRHR